MKSYDDIHITYMDIQAYDEYRALQLNRGIQQLDEVVDVALKKTEKIDNKKCVRHKSVNKVRFLRMIVRLRKTVAKGGRRQ